MLAILVGCSDTPATTIATAEAPAPKAPADVDAVASFQEVVRQVEERAKSPSRHLVLRKAPRHYYKTEYRLAGPLKWVVRRTDSPSTPYEAEVESVLQGRKYPESQSEEETMNSSVPTKEVKLELKSKYFYRENAWVLEKRNTGLWPLDDTPFVHKEYEWVKLIR